jgi:hypothetical protein
MMTGQAKSEVILELLRMVKVGAKNVFPVRQDAEETIWTISHFDQPAGFPHWHAGLEKRRGVTNLR